MSYQSVDYLVSVITNVAMEIATPRMRVPNDQPGGIDQEERCFEALGST